MTSTYLTVREVADLARCEHDAVRCAIADGRLTVFQPAHPHVVRADDARRCIHGRQLVERSERGPNRRFGGRGEDSSVASTTRCVVLAAIRYALPSYVAHGQPAVFGGTGRERPGA